MAKCSLHLDALQNDPVRKTQEIMGNLCREKELEGFQLGFQLGLQLGLQGMPPLSLWSSILSGLFVERLDCHFAAYTLCCWAGPGPPDF